MFFSDAAVYPGAAISLRLSFGSFLVLVLLSACAQQGVRPEQISRHPLDNLSAREIKLVHDVLQKQNKLGAHTRFGMVELYEPAKSSVIAAARQGPSLTAIPRRAQVLLYDWQYNRSSRALVDLKTRQLLEYNSLEYKGPPSSFITVMRIEEIVFADPRWQAAMNKRNIKDYQAVSLWPDLDNYSAIEAIDGNMVVEVVSLDNNAPNAGDRYLPFYIKVDLSNAKVLHFREESYDDKLAGADPGFFAHPKAMPPLKPLDVVQTQGVSFNISGSKLRWQNWELRFGMHPRRGLELYDVAYHYDGQLRPVLYRAAISEMITPYGDPNWYSWYPSDVGDLGFANYSLLPAQPGDAPANSVHRPAVIHDDMGRAREIPRAVSIYERNGGVLWRHFNNARWARELVLASRFMVDNYDYVLNYILRQDGSINIEIQLTGMINYGLIEAGDKLTANTTTTTLAKPKAAEHWISNIRVAPAVFGPIHQHFFNFRLDFDVDGTRNSIAEMNTRMIPKEQGNASQQWFATQQTPLLSEQLAIRKVNINSARWWKVYNAAKINALGLPAAYAIKPGRNAWPHQGEQADVRRRFAFINANLWVTPYQGEQMYAAGRYLRPGYPRDGLRVWADDDQSLEQQDLVVWYTFGVTHLPRPEDWPMMPVASASFALVPFGFFEENPALHASQN